MKKILLMMLCLASYVSGFAGTNTVYYAVPAETVGEYTVKFNAKLQTDVDNWTGGIMTKTNKTYFGKYIYSYTFEDTFGGVATMQFQLYDGNNWVSQVQPISSWEGTSTFNGRMYEHNIGWRTYNYDKTVTIHCKATDTWSPLNCHNFFNDGATGDVSEANWPGNATTQSTLNTDWYDYTITGRPCTKVIINNGKKSGEVEGTDKTSAIEIGDASEYWVTDGAASTTATDVLPASFNYTRGVTSGRYGTICLPYAATIEGATIYVITSKVMDGTTLKGINVEPKATNSVDAGVAYVFKGTSETLTATLSGNYTDAVTGGSMMGNLDSDPMTVPADADNYVVSNNQIRKVVSGGDGVTIAQYKAYISLGSIGAGARGANFIGSDDEGTTGIETVNAENNHSVVYNLQGQRVNDTLKGLVIVNGKKLLRK